MGETAAAFRDPHAEAPLRAQPGRVPGGQWLIPGGRLPAALE